eukprot:SAG11_NODE_1016_length_6169_cov_19.544975_6_plen_58_part_00
MPAPRLLLGVHCDNDTVLVCCRSFADHGEEDPSKEKLESLASRVRIDPEMTSPSYMI